MDSAGSESNAPLVSISTDRRATRRAAAVLVAAAILAFPHYAANAQRPIRVVILPVEFVGTAADSQVIAQLPPKLREALNRADARFAVELADSTRLPVGARGPLSRTRVPDHVLLQIVRADTTTDVRLVRIAVAYDLVDWKPGDDTLLTAAVTVLSPSLSTILEFSLRDARTKAAPLVAELADQLLIQLGKSIRIAMLEFPMIGGDRAKYGSLERSLPSMLTTGLNLSSRLVLVESLDRDRLRADRNESLRVPGLFDPLTAVRIGRELNANYYVMGEYWELGGALRIDVRCVNIESREIIVTRGIVVDPVSMRAIQNSIVALAADLRAAIESDFVHRSQRPRYVATVGARPVPNTGANRALTREIVRTVTRKLLMAQGGPLFVREPVDTLVPTASGLWALSYERNADLLLLLHVDHNGRDRVVIDAELFDQDKPRNTTLETYSGSIVSLDSLLDVIAHAMLLSQGVPPAAAVQRQMRNVRYRGSYEAFKWSADLGLSVRTDARLFLGTGAGVVVAVGPVLAPFGPPGWQIEPLRLRLDLFGSRAGNRRVVVGADVGVGSLVYKFRPSRSLNPFAGGGPALLGVIRRGPGDIGFAARPGGMLQGGVEHTLPSGRRLVYKLEWTNAMGPIERKTIAGDLFAGGRPGGVYMTVGIVR